MDIAYQLYTSRRSLPLRGQFSFLRAIGYEHIELWPGAYEVNPKGLRKALDEAGLDAPSVHIPDLRETDDLDRFIDLACILGARMVVRPDLAPDCRPMEQDGWKRLAERLSAEAHIAEKAGLEFAWHNHGFEFAPLRDGSRPIDLLMDCSDAKLRLELDCGWVHRAGGDVEAELKRFADRIIAIHAKDVAPPGVSREEGWAAFGDGVIDWAGLLPHILATDATLLVVEHDEPADWEYVALRSIESLSELLEIEVRGQSKTPVAMSACGR